MSRLSVDLHRFLFEEERSPKVCLADVLDIGGERIFGFVFALLGLILALPFPIPGHAIPIGFIILVLAIQLIVGAKTPWLPKGLIQKPIPLETVQGVMKKGIPWLERIEILSRPRMTYICTGFTGRIAIGIALTIMALFIMVPLPVFNTVAGFGVLITGLGLLDDDGVICLAGLVVCGISAAVCASLLIGIVWGGSSMLDLFKHKLGH
ncbi:MAG TPA: hypothetical protein DDZ80_22490 [Cyanobacteria bacterium UBA8803]|nr:hypothetical protein [Cyanobacteria bacterium UBA9273]HBL61096.1 hypothetical protein [Cyanobacteria bacterium UBA8803]